MSNFDELRRVVREAIRAGRIGVPVFVRCLTTVAPDADALEAVAQVVHTASEWIDSPVRRLYAVESPAPRQRSVFVEFAGGATALIGTTPAALPVIVLIVLGNHGALYHETVTATSGRDAARDGAGRGDAVDPALRAAIEAALRSGQPQVLPEKDSP